MQYPAIIVREGKFTLAEFPDCPGCQTFVEDGESIEVAAKEALEGWLESNLGRDLAPPRPSSRKYHHSVQVPVNPFLAVRLELRWARDDAELTQAHLARKVGMTQQQLARLESGSANPTVATLSRVAAGLGRRVVVSLERTLSDNPVHVLERSPSARLQRPSGLLGSSQGSHVEHRRGSIHTTSDVGRRVSRRSDTGGRQKGRKANRSGKRSR